MNTMTRSPAPPSRTARRDFPTPRPNPILMWALGFVNRWFILSGLPLLRHIPLVRDLPGVRGYLRIRLDLPADDRARLTRAVNPATAAFLGPNHPEFGADWMIDKEISSIVAPTMASWAAHEIVSSAPAFWRANNLVSNRGGNAAMEYSISWALAGKSVLLHPEGSVHWTSDRVHPLFGGIADLAIDTARRVASDGGDRPVFIVPLVWKLRYRTDVGHALRNDMARIERALGLSSGEHLTVAKRFHALQENILALQCERFGYHGIASRENDFFDRQHLFRLWLIADLETRYSVDASGDIDRRIHRLGRAVHAERSRLRTTGETSGSSALAAQLRDDQARVDEANRLGGFSRESYSTRTLTQEQIAESLKRLRAALVRRGTINVLHNYLPRPYGARVAYVRVPEPIRIDPRRASLDADDRDAYAAQLLEEIRRTMQETIDAINAEHTTEIAALSHANPFVVDRASSVAVTRNGHAA